MLKIDDSDNGNIMVYVESKQLDKDTGEAILKEVPRYFDRDRNILINMDKVEHLTSEGFGALYELMKLGSKKHTYIRFTNVNENYDEKISTLTTTSES